MQLPSHATLKGPEFADKKFKVISGDESTWVVQEVEKDWVTVIGSPFTVPFDTIHCPLIQI